MPSWLTGSGSALTGNDSALTATGVCAPLHPDFIKDGASFLTGSESVLTATTPPACEEPHPPIVDDGFLWLNNKVDPAGLMVKDGSDRLTTWINQFTGPHAAVDSQSADAHGVPIANSQKAVWTQNVQNGLPGMLWSRAAFTNQNAIYPDGTLNKPTADNEPVTILAVVRPFDLQGGHVLTLRLNNVDCEFMLEHYQPAPTYQQPMSAAQDVQGVLFEEGLIDYSNQTLLIDLFN